MRHSCFRGLGRSLVLGALLTNDGCSMGTNTGNGAPGCAAPPPCSEPASLAAPDGQTYRGRVWPEGRQFINESGISPPIAKLTIAGSRVDYSDGGCHDGWLTGNPVGGYQVQIFIFAEDSTIDASGTLRVHAAPRDGDYASGPTGWTSGWAVDLTVTAGGMLNATLSGRGDQFAGTGAGGGRFGADAASIGGSDPDGGPSSRSFDAGAVTHTITISGPLAPFCGMPAIGPVSGGGMFTFPCWQVTNCDFSRG